MLYQLLTTMYCPTEPSRSADLHVFKPSSKIPRCYFFCGPFMFFLSVFAIPLYASVYLCLVITCWERVGLLALVCGV